GIIGIDVVEPKEEAGRLKAFHEASIVYAARINAIFTAREPDLVIHAAAWTDVDGCEEDPDKARLVNTTGTQNIVKAAAHMKIPLIFISTDFVFDGEKETAYKVDDQGKPISVYGKTKWEAEEIVRRDLDSYMIIRTSWLYGKNGKNFVDTIISKSKTEKKLKIVNDQVGSPTYAKDVARAIKELIDVTDVYGQDTYHITNGGRCSWYVFARQILADIKAAEGIAMEPITAAELGRPAPRPRFSTLDNSKFNKKTGYIMRPWDDALRDYIENECVY
ncbi:MAG: dTDP-4-dehydrorhamnose reductase, partial [Candidatus Omnitrophota bacterium]